MKPMIVAYLATLLAFLGLDAIWLSLAGGRIYRAVLKDILLEGFSPTPAVAFYLIFAAGLVILAVRPGLATGSLRLAAGNGALIGFLSYATYDLSNQATLRNWTAALTLTDLTWGTVLSAVAATAGYLATRAFAA